MQDCQMRVLRENVNSSLYWRSNSIFIRWSFLAQYQIICNKNLCSLSVILKLFSALLSILIDFNKWLKTKENVV